MQRGGLHCTMCVECLLAYTGMTALNSPVQAAEGSLID